MSYFNFISSSEFNNLDENFDSGLLLLYFLLSVFLNDISDINEDFLRRRLLLVSEIDFYFCNELTDFLIES